MNRITRIAALTLSLAAAGSAFAESPNVLDPQPSVSTASRADVIAQVLKARAAGTLVVTEADLNKFEPVTSSRTRAEVRAETLLAIANGEVLGGGEIDTVALNRVAKTAAAVQLAGLKR